MANVARRAVGQKFKPSKELFAIVTSPQGRPGQACHLKENVDGIPEPSVFGS